MAADDLAAGPASGLKRSFREARFPAVLGLLWLVWGIAFAMGEKLPENDGLGWDGVRFAKMVEGGPPMLTGREINSYYVQRVGPSFVVRAVLQAMGVRIETASIRGGFIALNLTLLSLALWLLMDAARRIGLSPSGRWILLLGGFLNMANGRLPIYYAPIGDSTAFFIGALLAWGYIARQNLAMVAAFLIAITSWPAAFLFLPLLVWPRHAMAPDARPTKPPATVGLIVGLVALPLGVALLAILSGAVGMLNATNWSRETSLAMAANGLVVGAAAASAIAMALRSRRELTLRPSVIGLAAVGALVGLSIVYVRSFESGSLAFGADTFAREMILFARSRAFAPLIGHVAYFSAHAVAAAVLWPSVLRHALSLGTGAFVCTALSGMIALDAESRRLSAFWPLVALLAAAALDSQLKYKGRFPILVGAMLVASKLWWPLIGPPLFPAAHEPGNYFNTQGPSMSPEAAVIHAVVAVALALWIGAGERRSRPSPMNE